MSSTASLASTSSWPTIVQKLDWPRGGVKFHYEDRYLSPEKLSLWLRKAFGPGNGKYVVRWISLLSGELVSYRMIPNAF